MTNQKFPIQFKYLKMPNQKIQWKLILALGLGSLCGHSESFVMNSLFVGFIAGVFGMAYFVYGKRQTKITAMMPVSCCASIRTSSIACFVCVLSVACCSLHSS